MRIPSKKSLGQHFLFDTKIRDSIVKAAQLKSHDLVLEIGPGKGFLTKELIKNCGEVIAVEIDDRLVEVLQQVYSTSTNLKIVSGDVRYMDLNDLISEDTKYKVVANLPYYAASRIIRQFLEIEHKPSSLTVMVQLEVANQMIASPGQMGMLSVAIQLYGNPKIVKRVSPSSFKPKPKVSSAVVNIQIYQKFEVEILSEKHFFEVVRGGFSAPRKQLRNSLSKGLNITPQNAEKHLEKCEIDPSRRPQTLSLKEWSKLHVNLMT